MRGHALSCKCNMQSGLLYTIHQGAYLMKKMLGLAAAGLLLSAGGAPAANKVTNLKFTVTVNGTTLSCTLAVTQTADNKRKITNNIVLTGYSSDCQFWGGGTIGQLAEDASNPASFTN